MPSSHPLLLFLLLTWPALQELLQTNTTHATTTTNHLHHGTATTHQAHPPHTPLRAARHDLRVSVTNTTITLPRGPSGPTDQLQSPSTTEICQQEVYSPTATNLNGALLLTCRQIHHETKHLYYKCSAFFFWDASDAVEWYSRRTTKVHEHIRALVYWYENTDVSKLVATLSPEMKPGVLKAEKMCLGIFE